MATSGSSDAGLADPVPCGAGAREFLPDPLLGKTVSEAMARALARREKSQQQAATGKILMFAGSKGGSGVTTVATNFAIALTKEERRQGRDRRYGLAARRSSAGAGPHARSSP